MKNTELKNYRRTRIKYKIRKRVNGTAERPRVSVYRSLKHLYVQFIDDVNSKTLFTVSTKTKEVEDSITKDMKSVDKSKLVGKIAAKLALEKNINEVVFDRNGYLYHGRVKAIADGAREGGLKF